MAVVGAPTRFALGAVLAVVLAGAMPMGHAGEFEPLPFQSGADWPMYGSSTAHNFSTGASPPPRLGLVWDLTGNTTLTSAVAADGFVYIADLDEILPPAGPNLVIHKVVEDTGSDEPSDGAWTERVVVPGGRALGPSRSLAVAGGRVYALFTVDYTTEYQEVLTSADLTASAGWTFTDTARWSSADPRPTRSAPVVAAGLIVFGSQDGTVYAVDETGTLQWSFSTGTPVTTVPAIFEDIVYVTAGSRLLYLDRDGLADGDQGVADTGTGGGDLILAVDAPVTIRASPVVADAFVYLDVAGELWTVDRTFGGAPVWSQATVHESVGTPTILGDVIVARRTDGRAYAYDRLTGQVEWVRGNLAAPADGEDMAAADGRVFLSARNGSTFDLVVLDAADGDVLDRNTTSPRSPLGAPILAGPMALVTEGGRLLAFRGQPDLAVSQGDVVMGPGTVRDNVVVANLSVTVRNVGDEPAFGVGARVFDGDPDAGGILILEFSVGSESRPLNPGGRFNRFTPDYDWSVGQHDIYVVVDRALPETHVDNNGVIVSLNVQAGPPPPPQVVGEGPYWVALLLGFLIGVAVLYLPLRRVQDLRRKETERKP